MSFASLCNQSGTIQRPAYTADAAGGHIATFAAVYSSIAGTLQPVSGRTRMEAARRGVDVSHTWYTPVSVATQTGDRLVVGGANYLIQWSEDQAGRGRVFAVHVLKKD